MKRFIVDFTIVNGRKSFICVDAENEFDAVRVFYQVLANELANDPWVPDELKEGKNFFELALANHTVFKVTERTEG